LNFEGCCSKDELEHLPDIKFLALTTSKNIQNRYPNLIKITTPKTIGTEKPLSAKCYLVADKSK